MQIDPARAVVLCFQFGGFDPAGKRLWVDMKPSTAVWIRQTFPPENVHGVNHSPYLCARNRAIRDIVLPKSSTCDWLLSIDHDVSVTHPGITNFLRLPGDLVSCDCRLPNENAWDAIDAFHTPMWRVRLSLLQVVQPPWFFYPYSADGCELLDCDCGYFRDKCLQAGFSVTHGGHCGHDYAGSYLPSSAHFSLGKQS